MIPNDQDAGCGENCGDKSPAPFARLRQVHRRQREICNELEMVADSLPKPDTALCRRLSDAIPHELDQHQRIEDEALFPLLSSRLESDHWLISSLQRLETEHIENSCYAREVSEGLVRLTEGCDRAEIEAIAFMLRGFFEAMRRHIAFESEVVLPFAEASLCPADLDLLQSRIEAILQPAMAAEPAPPQGGAVIIPLFPR